MGDALKHVAVTEKIIGCAFRVHSSIGCGFQEVIYQRALAAELSRAGLPYSREIEQNIHYKNFPGPIGTRRADFVVDGKILVELKAVACLEPVHWAQVLNYLRAYKLDVGLLLNFGSRSLTFKRLVL